MDNKLIEINNKTEFAHIMNYANCETTLYRKGSYLIYFKIKVNEKWEKLVKGDFIKIDEKYNIIHIK